MNVHDTADAATHAALIHIQQRLLEAQQTISVAESLTAGHVQSLLASLPGASDCFEGGITAYTIEQKVALLGVSRREAAGCNCVSEPVVRQMALGARKLFGTNFTIATTGYAEPAPEVNVTRPFAWVAVALDAGQSSGRKESKQRAIASRYNGPSRQPRSSFSRSSTPGFPDAMACCAGRVADNWTFRAKRPQFDLPAGGSGRYAGTGRFLDR